VEFRINFEIPENKKSMQIHKIWAKSI